MPHPRRRRLILSAMLSTVALAGAGASHAADTSVLPILSGDQSAVALEPARNAVEAAQSADGWRDELGVFKAGLVRGWSADMSPAALARLEKGLAAALGMPARVVTFERFSALIDAQERGAIDYAVYSARAYAAAQLACECLDVLVQPTSAAGGTGQRARLFGEPSVMVAGAGVDGIKVGRVASGGIKGDAMARGLLKIAGVSVTGDEAWWEDFPSLDSARAAYDAGAIDAYFAVTAEDGDAPAALAHPGSRRASTLWLSERWPFGPHAVRSALSAEPKRLLTAYLTGLDLADPPLHALLSEGLAGPLVPVRAEEFRAVRRAVQARAGTN
jgi:phosphonate transport system substrate-binding protein